MKFYEAAILAIPVMLLNLILAVVPAYFLWNWVIPDLFSLPSISFTSIICLVLLVKVITGDGFFKVNYNN